MWFIIPLFATCIAFIGVDMAFVFWRWQSRIHIGRWQDKEKWETAIRKKCHQWLRHTPILPIKDYDRLILWDIIRNKYKSSTIQSWQKAGLMLGLGKELGFNIGFQIAQEEIGETSQVDTALIAYAILDTYPEKANELRPLMDTMLQRIMEAKGDNITIPYRKGLNSIKFVDTLGFVCPFLMMYAQIYNQPQIALMATTQLQEYDQALLTNWGFPAHAYDILKKAPLGLYDWGRGMGWYIMALLSMNRHAINDIIHRDINERIVKLGEKLLLCSLPGGGFAHQLLNCNIPAEGSATVMIAMLMQKCHELTGDIRFEETAEFAVQRLMRMTRRNGALDGCQGDTKGIGTYSTRFDIMPFAQGILLRLIKNFSNNKA